MRAKIFRLFEIALVLVRLDQVASRIVNANDGIRCERYVLGRLFPLLPPSSGGFFGDLRLAPFREG